MLWKHCIPSKDLNTDETRYSNPQVKSQIWAQLTLWGYISFWGWGTPPLELAQLYSPFVKSPMFHENLSGLKLSKQKDDLTKCCSLHSLACLLRSSGFEAATTEDFFFQLSRIKEKFLHKSESIIFLRIVSSHFILSGKKRIWNCAYVNKWRKSKNGVPKVWIFLLILLL